jgi:hypothetical protein
MNVTTATEGGEIMSRTARFVSRACSIVCSIVVLATLTGVAHAQNAVGGTGYGVRVDLLGGPTLAPSPEVVLPDAGGTATAHLLTLAVPTAVSTGTLRADATGTAAGPANVTTTASVEDLNLLSGLVTADLVVARSTSTGNGTTASSDSTGSQFVNLVVAGVPIVIFPAPNTVISVPGIATVYLNEQIPGGNGTSTSSLTVNMIRVVLLNGAGEAVVSSAHSEVDFRPLAALCLCPQPDNDLTGEAYGLHVSVDPPLIDTGRDPHAVLSSAGGSASAGAASATVGTLLASDTVTAETTGTLAPNSGTSQSTATVEGLSLLGGLITADLVVSRATSTGNGTAASSSAAGSQFVNLVVLGVPIVLFPAPNTVIVLPLVGTVTLNEQTTSGNGTTTSGMVVNMIHVRLNGTLGDGDIIVASAESGVDVEPANVCQNPCTDDGNLCNGSSVCDAFLGCTLVPLVCDDGNACNGSETCDPQTGCQEGTPLVCDDGNVCNGAETCNPASGCVPGAPLDCSDGNACNGTETCHPQNGCQAGTPLTCDDQNVCNGAETCSPATGCVPGVPLDCSDGNACNGTETCHPQNGCQEGTPPVCNDGNVCNGIETCNPATGCVDGQDLVCQPDEVCRPSDGCVPAPDCEFMVESFARIKDGGVVEGDLRAAQCGGFLTLGRAVFMADFTTIEASLVQLGNGSDVYHVASDDIRQGQDVNIRGGTSSHSCPLPFCSIPDLVCGGPRVTVPKGGGQTLSPGNYGNVSVGNNATLRLQPGAYTFCSFKSGRASIVEVQGPAPSTIYIDGKLTLGNGSSFTTTNGAPVPDVLVSGTSARFGALAIVDAHLTAPDASLNMGRNFEMRGSFCVRRANSDHSIRLACEP